MKHFCIFIVVFLAAGLDSVSAQDMIVMKNGNIIEAKITEISPAEIRYLRSDRLDGPTVVVPATGVLGIRYENGDYEVINAGPVPETAAEQERARAEKPVTTAMDPDKFVFAFNANPAGYLNYAVSYGGGFSLCLEGGKGKFNTEIHLIFPGLDVGEIGGFGGVLVTLNYFKHRWNGGFYAGGGLGRILDIFTFGLNIGYKFVTKSGVYFRTGGYVGIGMYGGYKDEDTSIIPYIRPDLAVGYVF